MGVFRLAKKIIIKQKLTLAKEIYLSDGHKNSYLLAKMTFFFYNSRVS